MKITITKHERGYTHKCLICHRETSDSLFYDVNVDYVENNIQSNHYRVMCIDCDLALKRHYKGVDSNGYILE